METFLHPILDCKKANINEKLNQDSVALTSFSGFKCRPLQKRTMLYVSKKWLCYWGNL